MICPKCHTDNPHTALACSRCNTPLAAGQSNVTLMSMGASASSPVAGFFIMGTLAFIAAIILGAVYHLVARSADIFILYGMIAGLGLGMALHLAIKMARCRNRTIIAALAMMAAALTMGTRLYMDSRYFISHDLPRVIENESKVSAETAEHIGTRMTREVGALTGLRLYLTAVTEAGVTIGHARQRGGIDMGGGTFWLLLVFKLGLIALVALGLGINAASEPFCERCQDWRKGQVLLRLGLEYSNAFLPLATAEKWEELARLPASFGVDKKNCCQLVLATCKECGESQVVLKQIEKGRDQDLWRSNISQDSAQRLRQAMQAGGMVNV